MTRSALVDLSHKLRPLTSSDPMRSAASRLGVLALSTVLVLASTRLIFEVHGSAAYAAMMLTAGLFALMPFADLGTGVAVTNAVAASTSPSSDDSVRSVMTAARWILVRAAAILVALGTVFLLPAAGERLLGDAFASVPFAEWGLALSIAFFGLALPLSLGQRVLLGVGRNYVAVRAQVAGPAVTLLGVWLVAAVGLPSGLIVAVPGLAVLVINIVMTILSRPSLGGAKSTVRSSEGAMWKRPPMPMGLLSTAGPMVIISAALALAYQSDRLVLSHVLGEESVAEYSVAGQIYAPLWSVVASAGLATWPMFTRARASGGPLRILRARGLAIACIAGMAGGGILVALGPVIGRFMTGSSLVPAQPVYWAFASLLVVQSAHLINGMMLNDPDGLAFQAKTVSAMLAVNLPLSVVLANQWGTSGPVWASAITTLLLHALPSFILANRRLRVGENARVG